MKTSAPFIRNRRTPPNGYRSILSKCFHPYSSFCLPFEIMFEATLDHKLAVRQTC